MAIDADKFMQGAPVVEDVVPEPYGLDMRTEWQVDQNREGGRPCNHSRSIGYCRCFGNGSGPRGSCNYASKIIHRRGTAGFGAFGSGPCGCRSSTKESELKERLEQLETRPAGVNARFRLLRRLIIFPMTNS